MNMRNMLSAKVIGIAAAAVCALLAAQGPASASTNQEFCEDRWARSSASDHCPNATISWFTKAGGVTCTVEASCAVDVNVDGNPERISGTVDFRTPRLDLVKLCIRRTTGTNGASVWKLNLSGHCGKATDAETAVEDGLSTQ